MENSEERDFETFRNETIKRLGVIHSKAEEKTHQSRLSTLSEIKLCNFNVCSTDYLDQAVVVSCSKGVHTDYL